MSKSPPIKETQPLSEEEKQRLELIREAHKDRIASHNVHYLTLLRYLRGYKDDPKPVEKSIEMLDKMLTWREEQKVDELVATRLPREDEFKRIWQNGTHGFGKEGNLIYVDRIGSVEPKKLMGEGGFSMEDVKKFHIQMMESVNRLKEEQYAQTGVTKYKNIVILDLDGMGMGHMGSKFTEPMKSFIKIDQEYYPESLYQMVICNAGWVVKTLWALASPWIDPITKERIKFGEKHLTEIIDAEQIPKFLGGKCKCKDGKCLIEPFQAGYDGPAPQPHVVAQGAPAAAASSSSSSAAAAPAPAAAAVPAPAAATAPAPATDVTPAAAAAPAAAPEGQPSV